MLKNRHRKLLHFAGNPGSLRGGTSLLSQATGFWPAADYITTYRRQIPNRNRSGALDQNIIVAPRRCFTTARWNRNLITTTTDNIATAPDGSTEASTIERTTTAVVWSLFLSGTNFTAGNYTIACSVRAVSGDATFRLQMDTNSGVLTATSSWQRFTYTATVTTGNKTFGMTSPAAGSIAKFEICDMEIFSGNSDLNTTWATLKPLKVRNLDFDIGTHGANQTAGSVSGGVITFGSIGSIALSALTAMGPYTLIHVASKNGGGADNTSQGGISGLTTGSSLFFSQRNSPYFGLQQGGTNLMAANAGYTSGNFGVQDIDSQQGRNGVKPVVFSASYSGTVARGFINGVELFNKTQTATAQNIADLQLTASPMYDFHAYVYFNRVLTAAEQLSVYNELNALYSIPASSIWVAEGDSITDGTVLYSSYPDLAAMSMTENVIGAVAANTGSVIVNATPSAGLTGRAAALDTILTNKGSRKAVLTVLIGANDLTNATRDAWLTSLYSYLDARRTAGWYVGLCTLLPRTVASGGDPAFLTARAYVNPLMVASVGTHCDFIINFAADATMGPDAAANDVSLYSDGLHPTLLGYQNLAAIAYPRIEANIP